MPCYVFEHPTTREVIEVVQSMKEEHVYVDEEGVEWDRVFAVPNASVDTTPLNPNQFVEKTRNQKGSMGDLFDQAKEASDKRAKVHGGEDPVKKEYFKKWSKDRNGKIHPSQGGAGLT
jgi:hypothetical protein